VYLGGRLVLGSGRTCPHDFLFLAGFFSGEDVSGRGTASPESADISGLLSSANDWGDMISCGFMVSVADGASKRGGYMSSGAERKDSAGDPSNLRSGDGV
jgi:hypothetical protein